MAPVNRHEHRTVQHHVLPRVVQRWPRVTVWLAWCSAAGFINAIWGRR